MVQQDFVEALRLIALGGGSTVAQIPLGRDLVVGRAPTCDIQLDEPNVNRRHARLVCDGGHVWLEDLRSRCGTTVNGAALDSVTERIASGRHRLDVGILRCRARRVVSCTRHLASPAVLLTVQG
jgi:S-DNA-T family DNA segregation ATPase FtsK/SpoIIIE